MFSLALTPSQIQAFSFGFLFFVLGVAAFFILSTNYRDKIARQFGFIAVYGALINFFALFYHIADNLEWARQWRIFSQAWSIPFTLAMVNFSLSLYEKYLPSRPLHQLLGKLSVLVMLIFAPFIVLDLFGFNFIFGPLYFLPPVQLSPLPGPGLAYYIAAFVVGLVFSTYLMVTLWRRGKSREARLMGLLMLVSMCIPVFARIANWAPWYGIGTVGYASLFVALLSGPIFAIGTTYAILRHKVFNLRLITAELFVFGLWTLLFFRALLSESFTAAIPDIVLLAGTIILGIFLIRSVLKEVEQREQYEMVSTELKVLNETLEQKVQVRTAELDQSKSHLETIVENLTVGLIEYDDKHRISRINRAAEALLGVRRKDVVGKTPAEFSNTLGVTTLATVLEEKGAAKPIGLVDAGSENLLELTIDYPERRDLQLATVSISTGEGKKGGKLKLIRDITQEKALERSKNEFISTAAHQLRTPLAALRWTIELFLGGGSGKVTKAQKELLEDGNRAGENMRRIVEDLLAAAKIDERRFGHEAASADLKKMLEELVPPLAVAAQEKEIKVELIPSGKPVPPFPFDPSKLSLAVQSLIDNAVKYSPKGATVEVRYKAEEQEAVIEVQDHGIGIAKEDIDKLFTKFFRARKAKQMFTDGSGLGLYITKSIVETHRGKVMVQSEVGKGSTFIIRLPLNPSPRPTKKAQL